MFPSEAKLWKCFMRGGMKRIYFCIPVLRKNLAVKLNQAAYGIAGNS